MAKEEKLDSITSLADLVPEVGEAPPPPATEAASAATMATVQRALDSANPDPDPELPPSDLVDLPGGLIRRETTIKTAQVRELTGRDEESLARATQSQNLFHFANTLLECGTVRLGRENPDLTPKLLKDMLIGDRDALILGIRRATYGDSIEIEDWKCPLCGGKTTLGIPLDEIPVKKINVATDREFDVPRRKGGFATVRLATGADQLEMFADDELINAQRNSILLSRCVQSLTDPDGTKHNLVGHGSVTMNLSIPDRNKIVRELAERQPGPRLNDVKFTHQACGNEVSLMIGLGDLFLDL